MTHIIFRIINSITIWNHYNNTSRNFNSYPAGLSFIVNDLITLTNNIDILAKTSDSIYGIALEALTVTLTKI